MHQSTKPQATRNPDPPLYQLGAIRFVLGMSLLLGISAHTEPLWITLQGLAGLICLSSALHASRNTP